MEMNLRKLKSYMGLELVNYMNAEFENMYAVVKDGEALFTDSNERIAYRLYDREFDKLISELQL